MAMQYAGFDEGAVALGLVEDTAEINVKITDGDVAGTYRALRDAFVSRIPVGGGPLGPLSEPVVTDDGKLNVRVNIPLPVLRPFLERLRPGGGAAEETEF